MTPIQAFILRRLLGFSDEQIAVILAGPKTARNLTLRGLAIILGSGAFTYGAYKFTHDLLGLPWWAAIPFSLFCGAMLLLVELYNLDEVLRTGVMSRMVLLTRFTVMGVMFLASLFAAVGPMQSSIDAYNANARMASAHLLESDSRYKTALESARQATEQAGKDVLREKDLQQQLSDLTTQHATAMANRENECKGNVGADGIKRVEGCGPRADGWKVEADRLNSARTAISSELSAIAGATNRLTSAQSALNTLNGQIADEAKALNDGATKRLGAMLDLLWSSGVAKLILAFYLLLSILPELLTLNALSPGGGHRAVLDNLKALEDLSMERAVQRLRANLRDGQAHQALKEGSASAPSAHTAHTAAKGAAQKAQKAAAQQEAA